MKKIIKLLVILVMPLLLCGCSYKKAENKKCLEGHTELKPMFFPSGNGQLRMVMTPRYVCDKWED